MKIRKKGAFPVAVVLACLSWMPVFRTDAQTFKTLYSFTNGGDGGLPYSGLVLVSNRLYGTASSGGASGNGTVFGINTDGSDFAALHSFSGTPHSTNGDGASSWGGLSVSGDTLFGTSRGGGLFGSGTVFSLSTDGSNFTSLYSFTATLLSGLLQINLDGEHPYAGMAESDGVLYGTTGYGGTFGNGTVFSVNTNGRDFQPLASFPGGTNGGLPNGELVLSGNTLYGTTVMGGSNGADGTVFSIGTSGAGFKTLHGFDGGDGASLFYGLILSSNQLYGTTTYGGPSGTGDGTVFVVNTDGTGFKTLHSFTGIGEGANPYGGLVLSGNTLYGTTSAGGDSGSGTIFALNTDGSGFTNLYSFTDATVSTNSDGAAPQSGLVMLSNTLYGTALLGGAGGFGTIFSLSLRLPQLSIVLSGTNVVLSWPTNFAGFNLITATNPSPQAAWTQVFPGPAVVNGTNAVTNPIAGQQQYYRLSGP